MDAIPQRLFIISAPSGTGKTSVFLRAKEILPTLSLSVSCTTRTPRPGEKHGVDYFFINQESFKERIEKQDFLEWAEVFGNYYGTAKSHIQQSSLSGDIIVLDIDVQGALQLMEKKDIDAIYIFIKPPSLEVLKARLISRKTETTESLRKRLGTAKKELSYIDRYDYSIKNDDLELAVDDLLSIIIRSLYLTNNKRTEKEQILKKLTSHQTPENQKRLKNIISNIIKTD